MAYEKSKFTGDDRHTIDCTGDCVTGDRVAFERATFLGSYRTAVFNGFEKVTGEIVKESYGKDRQQHTFTLLLADGRKTRIKGRNLYANGIWRMPWDDEAARELALDEKHSRGDRARLIRCGETAYVR